MTTNIQPADHLLREWLARRLPAEALRWLREKEEAIAARAPARTFLIAFSAAPRYIGKAPLALQAADLDAAAASRSGWQPADWSADQAARCLLLLALPDDASAWQAVDLLASSAEVRELIALYQALPLLPEPQRHVERAREGLRSNAKAVFNAVAHHNPFPAEQFDDIGWNQMILKAVFIGSPLAPIHGLEGRATPELARMLMDYVHERWAAGRDVTPEVWRLIGPYADEVALDALARVLADARPEQHEAAALALSACSDPRARALLEQYPELIQRIEQGRLVRPGQNSGLEAVAS